MSERALNLSFMGMLSALLTALDVISIIILFIMMMMIGNTIAMGVRERTREYGVLRALGFVPAHIRTFVIGEAAVLGWWPARWASRSPPHRGGGDGAVAGREHGRLVPLLPHRPRDLRLATVFAIAGGGWRDHPAVRAGRLGVTDALAGGERGPCLRRLPR
jgi:putative ABC transport system permease protein